MSRRAGLMVTGNTVPAAVHTGPEVSVDLNGTDEQFLNSTEQTIGIANAWTVGVWLKSGSGMQIGNSFIIDFTPSSTNNSLSFEASATNKVKWFNRSSSGNIIKDYRWNNGFQEGVWELHMGTWNGTTIQAYINAVSLGSPDIAITDVSGTMTDGTRQVALGANINTAGEADCILYSCMVWNKVLGNLERVAVYNGGNAKTFNANANTGNYVSAGALVHWWELGKDSGDIGADSTLIGTPIDVGANSINISAADIVSDFPGI